MLEFLNISHTLLVIPGTSIHLSYIEALVVSFNLITVVLFRLQLRISYVFSLITCALLAVMLYQLTLYADMAVNMYYVVMALFGLYSWRNSRVKVLNTKVLCIKDLFLIMIVVTAVSITLGTHIDSIFSYIADSISYTFDINYTHKPSVYPYFDAFVAVSSMVAMYLMTQKYVASWALWTMVNVLNAMLYYNRGMMFISVEYILLSVNSIWALIEWNKHVPSLYRS